ncbi:DUF1345 domain-containing protein [Sabulicella glaciei]|uniref:DUF1345 domain-containing protein n=1 Tax=Sabulicella glaciei TaxID=2984948 RepID=A0ABT3P1R7_9PROT|nr:DUF1345 domain-containing protein [Roseococcus sp. MDT2-1-1]MCW8088352.1 DUF1345 domain-containing protein [Roseococcus sp. MDT2-1-1]
MRQALRNRFIFFSLILGGAIWAVSTWAGLPGMDGLMAGWITHVVAHAIWVWKHLGCASPDAMRERTRRLGQGRATVLGIAVLAASVAGGTVMAELVMQKEAAAWERVLAVVTIIAAWVHMHLLFAQEYAHEYWEEDRGLDFPGGDGTPEFTEFLYVAAMVGTAGQVSDTPTNKPDMRKLVMIHALVSFAFNAAILAATLEVLGNLAG